MIKHDDIFIADLKDDFELAGKDNEEFSLYSFIDNDLEKAFWLGYCINDWKESIWIPFKMRKQIRHIHEDLEKYNPQLNWLNSKCSKGLPMIDYANYLLDNIITESYSDLIKISFMIGLHLKEGGKK